MSWGSSWFRGSISGSGGASVSSAGVELSFGAEPADPLAGVGILFINVSGDLCFKENIAGVIKTCKLTENSYMGGSGEYPEIFTMQG